MLYEQIKSLAPCFIYDEQGIKNSCRELKMNLPGFEFLYSIKANPFKPVIKSIAQEGFGSDSASYAEVEKSLSCGINRENIYFSSPGKTERDIRNAFGKCILIADSLNELKLIQRVALENEITAKIGLRINPGFSMNGVASSSKFGIDIEHAYELKNVLNYCPNVKIIGLHVHLMSQILNSEIIAEYYQNVMSMALKLKEDFNFDIEFVNFGSGIGALYDKTAEKPFNLKRLHERTRDVIKMNETLKARLLIETGRYITCNAGKYYTPVIDKKISHGTTYLIVLNAMNGFLRPAIANIINKFQYTSRFQSMEPLFTCKNEFEVKVLNNSAEQEKVNIVGNLCTALDTIAEQITVNKAEIGDIIEISNAGSYGFSLSPQFFGSHEIPCQFLKNEDGTLIEG